MKQLKLVPKTDLILRGPCERVTRFDQKLKDYVHEMHKFMIKCNGVGLSANQVGLDKRICIIGMKLNPRSSTATAMINPEMLEAYGRQENVEGCLSLPGEAVLVGRPLKALVRYQDTNGKFHEILTEGLVTAVIAHELDHLLYGKLITDYADEDWI